jgi:lipopolysaccharide/colanic/teichoic acid biosynthesis glycosyltransferase
VGPLRMVSGERLRPGITGLWLTAGDVPGGTEKDRLDMYYLQNWSITTDLEIMILSMKYLPGLFEASGSEATSKEGEE